MQVRAKITQLVVSSSYMGHDDEVQVTLQDGDTLLAVAVPKARAAGYRLGRWATITVDLDVAPKGRRTAGRKARTA